MEIIPQIIFPSLIDWMNLNYEFQVGNKEITQIYSININLLQAKELNSQTITN